MNWSELNWLCRLDTFPMMIWLALTPSSLALLPPEPAGPQACAKRLFTLTGPLEPELGPCPAFVVPFVPAVPFIPFVPPFPVLTPGAALGPAVAPSVGPCCPLPACESAKSLSGSLVPQDVIASAPTASNVRALVRVVIWGRTRIRLPPPGFADSHVRVRRS